MRINSPYLAVQPSRVQSGGPVPFSVGSTVRYSVAISKVRTFYQAHFLEEKLNKNTYVINQKNFKGISLLFSPILT